MVLYLAPSKIKQYLLVQPPPYFNKIIFAPKSINPNTNNIKEVLELKLQGQNYIYCVALIKKLKYIKKYTSPIWL